MGLHGFQGRASRARLTNRSSQPLPCTFMKSDRAKIISALILFPMRCHSVGWHHTVIRVYNTEGNVIETHEQAASFKEW